MPVTLVLDKGLGEGLQYGFFLLIIYVLKHENEVGKRLVENTGRMLFDLFCI